MELEFLVFFFDDVEDIFVDVKYDGISEMNVLLEFVVMFFDDVEVNVDDVIEVVLILESVDRESVSIEIDGISEVVDVFVVEIGDVKLDVDLLNLEFVVVFSDFLRLFGEVKFEVLDFEMEEVIYIFLFVEEEFLDCMEFLILR